MIAFTYPPTNLAHLVVVLMATFPEFSISSALEHPALPNPEISIALVAILIRWTVASWPYSGMNSPPMYGDFEAQRHWMEITNGIPVAQWYKDTDGNDLSYWGLDYPPLTAFHSWICGKIGLYWKPQYFELIKSRGAENYSLKLYMRLSVLISDMIFFMPSAIAFVRYYYKDRTRGQRLAALSFILLNPVFILVDHGHFQYNSVCLGLCLWSVVLILKGRQLYGSILYTCSFLFKQISLYYSVGFFFYLLSWALEPSLSSTSVKFTRISLLILNVVSTVGVSLLPWALASHSVTEFFQHLAQIVHRLFPFARGIFEDKVSNFWCISSLLIKWKRFFSLSKLIRLSTFATILGSFPSGILFLLRSRMQRRNDFLILLSISSLAFFLFSFQVHEKSILFPSLPISLLVLEAPYLVTWFQSIALFSMFPLFFKDGLSFPYFTSQFLLLFLGYKLNSRSAAFGKYYSIFLSGIMFSYLGWVTLHAIHYQFPLPGDLSPRYPDLVNYGIATFSFFHFLGAWILLQLALFCSPKAKQQ